MALKRKPEDGTTTATGKKMALNSRKPEDGTTTATSITNIAIPPLNLRSLHRTMSAEQATAEAAAIEGRITTVNKDILCFLDDLLKATQEMKRRDAERLMELASSSKTSNGSDLSHDICLVFKHGLCTRDEFSRFVDVVAKSSRGSWFKVETLMGLVVAMKDSNPMVAPFAKDLFCKILTSCCSSSFDFKFTATFVELARLLALVEGDNNPEVFVQVVLAKAQEMENAERSISDGYHSVCPILNLLYPVYEVMREKLCPRAKQSLGNAIKLWLEKSIQAYVNAPPMNYSMPELAAQAATARWPDNDDLEMFLLSRTQTELRLNLSTMNGCRMSIHRLIDEQLTAYGTLTTHLSEGSGQEDRILVIKKTAAAAEEMRKRRFQRHQELLAEMKTQFHQEFSAAVMI